MTAETDKTLPNLRAMAEPPGNPDFFSFPPLTPPPSLSVPFPFGVIGLAHNHIYEICDGLIGAGAILAAVYDPDPGLCAAFLRRYPQASLCTCAEDVLDLPIRLLASAAVPSERADIAIAAMKAGKDVVVDKAPFLTLDQLQRIRATIRQTNRLYSVFYGESVTNAATLWAGELLRRGVIGPLYHIDGMAPHRLNPAARADWFFRRRNTGGILTDLICHQIHQVLTFTDSRRLIIDRACAANRFHPEHPELDDMGELSLHTPDGITAYLRVDWNAPAGIPTWGDARMILSGRDGYMELRKNYDLCHGGIGSYIYIVTQTTSACADVSGKVCTPYFSQLIADILSGIRRPEDTERSLYAAETAIRAQILTGRI